MGDVKEKAARAMVTFEQFLGLEGPACMAECQNEHGFFMTTETIKVPMGQWKDLTLGPLMKKVWDDGPKAGEKILQTHLPAEVDGLYQMILHEEPSVWNKWNKKGAALTAVKEHSFVKKNGMFAGDIIKSINGEYVLEKEKDEISKILRYHSYQDMVIEYLRIDDEAITKHVKHFNLNYLGSTPGNLKAGLQSHRRRALLVHEETFN